jgi:hypothetical protein
MLDKYRREFVDFNINLNRTRYFFFSGQKVTFPTIEIYDRYSDLFTLSAIDSLKKEYSETDPYYQTKCKALFNLIAFASQQYLNLKVKHLTQEITNAESRLYITWKSQKIPISNVNSLLNQELDYKSRQEIYQKKLSALSSINDLKAERIEKLHDSSQLLGYSSYLEMLSKINGIDYLALNNLFQKFLADTEKIYNVNLKKFLALNLRLPLEQATQADILVFTKQENFVDLFPSRILNLSFQETLTTLNIWPKQQKNIYLDAIPRTEKQLGTFCLPIVIPNEIKVVYQHGNGVRKYQSVFQARGKSQYFAFNSSSLTPEFKYAGDNGLIESYGFLFRHLVNEPFWLEQMLHERESSELQTTTLLTKLYLIRSYAAKLNYEIALHSKGLSQAAEFYSNEISQATLFYADKSEYLTDYLDNLYVANYLRAICFEVMLRDYLKTHFGYKWWQSARAGNLLKEMWNEGTRYNLTEFAQQLSLGDFVIEPLEIEFLLNLKS